ncbi:unnamed protein product [marine sediment metagenome]|uniref:Uncharacterized protein n=1 Tax=marine sediment metagenome TaxID=412755 RepID=X1LQ43_9ZZZZ
MKFRELQEGLRVGDNLKVILPGGTVHYYKILNRDQVFYRDTHVEEDIAAGGASDYTEITNLNPPANEIIQVYKIKNLLIMPKFILLRRNKAAFGNPRKIIVINSVFSSIMPLQILK